MRCSSAWWPAWFPPKGREALKWILHSSRCEVRLEGGRRTLHGLSQLRALTRRKTSFPPCHLKSAGAQSTGAGSKVGWCITFLLPVLTISCSLNPWFLCPSAARGWESGTINSQHPSVPAHSTEGGQGSDSCGATLTCAAAGPKKFQLV